MAPIPMIFRLLWLFETFLTLILEFCLIFSRPMRFQSTHYLLFCFQFRLFFLILCRQHYLESYKWIYVKF